MAVSISMVLLSDKPQISIGEIARDFADRWPDAGTPSDFDDRNEDVVAFSLGEEANVFFALMPAPIPWSDLEGPCATSILWKNASEEVAQHQMHLIVTVTAELEPMEMSRLLTQASVSLMATCPHAMGIYWGNATMVIPKDLFVEFATEVMPLGPPLHVWVDFRVGPGQDGSTSGFTCGMRALGHLELETVGCPEPPGELRDRFVALAGYVLENGPVINDGDTVGEDMSERILVVYSDSEFGHEEKVMRLTYEPSGGGGAGGGKKKPWWKIW